MDDEALLQACIDTLVENDRGDHTIPAAGLYPHQWLWDSCFIAIGQRHYDITRAQLELVSLLKGQWHNGMIPNMVLTRDFTGKRNASFWQSNVSPYSPDDYATSGITQPPMLAEAVVRIGEKLGKEERKDWYRKMYPKLIAYHKWFYKDRRVPGSGLVFQTHPWETGLDNTPPWMSVIHSHAMPLWIRVIAFLRLDAIIGQLRSDRKFALPGERLSTIDALSLYSIQRLLRRHQYDTKRIVKHSNLVIADVSFNAIFIRANQHLQSIAKELRKPLPPKLLRDIEQTEKSFEELWDPYSGQYYSKDIKTGQLIKIPTIGTLIALYSGAVPKERAKQIIKQLNDSKQYGTKFLVATVPVGSEWFSPHLYWQGPTWINANWLVEDGLKRLGLDKEASRIAQSSIELVRTAGMREYFSPIDGSPAGAHDFSWTAALVIDFLNNQ